MARGVNRTSTPNSPHHFTHSLPTTPRMRITS